MVTGPHIPDMLLVKHTCKTAFRKQVLPRFNRPGHCPAEHDQYKLELTRGRHKT